MEEIQSWLDRNPKGLQLQSKVYHISVIEIWQKSKKQWFHVEREYDDGE